MKRPNRRAVPKRKAVKRAAVKPVKPAKPVKPVEVVKVALAPDKVPCIEAPRDHVPVVAVHPGGSMVEIAAVPAKKKKQTFFQWAFGNG